MRSDTPGSPDVVDRRRFLRRGAIAAAVGAASAGALADSARAADGTNLVVGANANNTPGVTTTLSGSTAADFSSLLSLSVASDAADTIVVRADHTGGLSVAGTALFGTSTAAQGTGVKGSTTTNDGFGVHGKRVNGSGGAAVQGHATGTDGWGVRAQSNVGPALLVVGTSQVIPPTSGNWNAGEIVQKNGGLWLCRVSGSGTSSQWVRISAQLTTLASPVRVYYSLGAGDPPLVNGEERAVTVTNGTSIPHGVSSVLTNLAVVSPSATGYLAMFPDGTAWSGTSNLNFDAGQTISNNATSSVSLVGGQGKVRVRCGGATAHVVVDVFGYYA